MPNGSSWLAAAAGFFFTYYNQRLQEERKARIERVNEQLREFYGPLLACITATKAAYDAMVKQHSPDGTLQGLKKAAEADPHGTEAKAYRMWMVEVLQPLNERAATIVQDRIDLLQSADVVQELLQLVAHVSTIRVILQRWKDGDYETSTQSAISYPDKVYDFIAAEFGRTKRLQAELLGMTNPVRAKL